MTPEDLPGEALSEPRISLELLNLIFRTFIGIPKYDFYTKSESVSLDKTKRSWRNRDRLTAQIRAGCSTCLHNPVATERP